MVLLKNCFAIPLKYLLLVTNKMGPTVNENGPIRHNSTLQKTAYNITSGEKPFTSLSNDFYLFFYMIIFLPE